MRRASSELNVAAFAHPTFNRQSLKVHILMRSSFAALLGQVMPFWMGASTLQFKQVAVALAL
jgi:hypothetical protein